MTDPSRRHAGRTQARIGRQARAADLAAAGEPMAADTAQPPSAATSNRLFVSYSRTDAAFVRWLCGALREAHGIDAWVDWEDIPPTAEWMAEIERGIDSADAFAFVISPRSLASKVCAQELAHAVSAGKRLLPVVAEAPGSAEVPASLARLNWIFARDDAERPVAVQGLAEALVTDLPALRMHARLLVRAREWLAAARDPSYLLRGADLDDAQRWLSAVGVNGPFPSPEHHEYLVASQQAQRAETERWRRLYRQAQARLLAAQSELLRAQDATRLELSVLLAAASLRTEPTLQAAQSLQQGLRLLPPRGALAVRHADGRINDLAFTPDGRWLLTAGDDGSVRAHDVVVARTHATHDTGGRAMALRLSAGAGLVAVAGYRDARVTLLAVPALEPVARLEHPTEVTALCWLPDAEHLVTAGADGRLRLWEAGSGAVSAEEPAAGVVRALACSGDGLALACAAADGALTMLDLPSRRLRWQQALGAELLDVAFSPDGRRVATGGWDLQARVFDAASGEPQCAVSHAQVVTQVCFSPDGQHLASASDDGIAAVLDIGRGEVIARLTPQGGVLCCTFSPDGRWLATTGLGSLAQVWDIATQDEVARNPGDSGANALAFHPDGSQLCVARWARADSVRLSSDGNDAPLRHGLRLQCAAFDPDGRVAALAPGDGTVRVVDLVSGRRLARFAVEGDIEFMQVSGDGARVLTQADLRLRAWDASCGRALWECRSDEFSPWADASRCGRYVLTEASAVGRVIRPAQARVLNAADGTLVATVPHTGPFPPRFSRDGERVLTTGEEEVFLWRSRDGAPLRTFQHGGDAMDIGFSNDGTRIAGSANDGCVRVWHSDTGEELLRLDHGGDYVAALAFSSNDRWLASTDKTSVRVWDAATGAQVHRFDVEGGVDCVSFTPDSAFVAAGSRDQRARIWALADGAEAACITHDGETFEMQFCHAGRYVLVEHMRGARRHRTAWRWRADDLLALADASVTRALTEEEWQQSVGDMPMPRGTTSA
ncbi:MAG TPA: TIR domain-containing protein [Mycobacterium sp.]|nr:TIR domain-containing protein [Mycobacterium sp.]